MVRWRWLRSTSLYALLAGAVLIAATTAALWLGTSLVDAPVSTRQVLEPMLGTLPLLALFTGLAVLSFGLVPRATVVVPVTLGALSYLLESFGTALHWPTSVLSLSPFHHLARLPGQPMTLSAVVVMSAVGVGAAAVGIIAFTRRDLANA